MTLYAGTSLPGPFFIAFPVLPIVGGALFPFLAIGYVMFYMVVGTLWLMGLLLYAIVWCIAKAVGHGFQFAIAHRDTRPALTTDEQAFLDRIMDR
jgi:hypothetical protein